MKVTKLHTPKSFMQFGWKQISTWVGIFGFIALLYEFRSGFGVLINNILRDPELAKQIIKFIGMLLTGSVATILVLINRFDKKD